VTRSCRCLCAFSCAASPSQMHTFDWTAGPVRVQMWASALLLGPCSLVCSPVILVPCLRIDLQEAATIDAATKPASSACNSPSCVLCIQVHDQLGETSSRCSASCMMHIHRGNTVTLACLLPRIAAGGRGRDAMPVAFHSACHRTPTDCHERVTSR
jgi:hypothetical protein